MTADELMYSALRHLEREMHGVAPSIVRRGLRDISDAGVEDSARHFLDAIRACVREEIEIAIDEPGLAS